MTHDPLCQAYVWETNPSPNIHYHGGCDCDLIALVRQDERRISLDIRVREVMPYANGYIDGEDHMLAKCIAAIIARPERYEETSDYYGSRDDGYAEGWVDDEGSILAALRALQEKP